MNEKQLVVTPDIIETYSKEMNSIPVLQLKGTKSLVGFCKEFSEYNYVLIYEKAFDEEDGLIEREPIYKDNAIILDKDFYSIVKCSPSFKEGEHFSDLEISKIKIEYLNGEEVNFVYNSGEKMSESNCLPIEDKCYLSYDATPKRVYRPSLLKIWFSIENNDLIKKIESGELNFTNTKLIFEFKEIAIFSELSDVIICNSLKEQGKDGVI